MPEIKRMTLWDKQFRLVWDSDLHAAMRTPSTPAYEAIDGWVHAIIVFTDGFRWTGLLFRTAEGVQRFSRDDLTYVTWSIYPMLEAEGHA
jgi:hypothetical protein